MTNGEQVRAESEDGIVSIFGISEEDDLMDVGRQVLCDTPEQAIELCNRINGNQGQPPLCPKEKCWKWSKEGCLSSNCVRGRVRDLCEPVKEHK